VVVVEVVASQIEVWVSPEAAEGPKASLVGSVHEVWGPRVYLRNREDCVAAGAVRHSATLLSASRVRVWLL